MKIPLLDLKRQYHLCKSEIDKAINKVLCSTQFVMGNEVKEFEKKIEYYLDCSYAISCGNGTDALVLALEALNIGKGDEVITTTFTFFATAEAISRVGAKPVFVDVNIETYNINPIDINKKITEKTKAIMPVHIFGQPVDMDSILEVAKKYNLYVIEDACQAIGAEYKGKKIGTIGDIGCFSFFPTKNLGAYGDGGMITTNNENLAKILKALRVHGSGYAGGEAYNILKNKSQEMKIEKEDKKSLYNPGKYFNYLIGYNSRLDEIQAAILKTKLKYLDDWNKKRRELALYYDEKLKDTTLILPKVLENIKSVYHLYIVQSEKRDELVEYLNKEGISTGIYYPIPLHLQKVYEDLGYKEGDLKCAEHLSKRTFALPLYPELTKEEQDYIVNAILEFEGRD